MKRLKLIFWAVVLGCVSVGIYRFLYRAVADFQTHSFEWHSLDFGYLTLAACTYLAGLLPCCWFWSRCLHALGQKPDSLRLSRAYFLGHLGKYVPGKAMVVVLRAAAVRDSAVKGSVAAGTVFIETLTMMAVGAFVAATVLSTLAVNQWLTLLGVLLATGSVIPTMPPVFVRLIRLLRLEKKIPADMVTWRLLSRGWLAMLPCWLLLGVSMYFVILSLPSSLGVEDIGIVDIPYLTAAVSLAMVAGFLSLLPGGILVRDYVVMEVLSFHSGLGVGAGVVAAMLLRVVWLLSEILISSILYAVPDPAGTRVDGP